mgnify:CR=1 FL=1
MQPPYFLRAARISSVGQQQGADTLGVILNDRLAEIVGKAAVTAGSAAKPGHQTDAAKLQGTVSAHAEMTVAGAVEGLLAVGGVPLGR